VERNAQSELIGTRVDGPAGALLGRNVQRGPHELTGASQCRGGVGIDVVLGRRWVVRAGERESEVGHAGDAIAPDEHVGRLEVAVNQAGLVCCLEALRCLDERVEDGALRPRLGREPGRQGLAVDQLHRDIGPRRVDARPVHRDDVGVGQSSERLGLAQQSLDLPRVVVAPR